MSNTSGSIMPDKDGMEAFVEKAKSGPDRPIVMLNLLRFADIAQYETVDERITGRDAYAKYSKAVTPMLWKTGGQLLWMGKVRSVLIAPDSEEWDEALLVQYPSRNAFLNMIQSDEYQAIVHHRTAALIDSRLIETTTVRIPRPLLAAARVVTRVRSRVGGKRSA